MKWIQLLLWKIPMITLFGSYPTMSKSSSKYYRRSRAKGSLLYPSEKDFPVEAFEVSGEMIVELKDQMVDCGRERMIEVIGIDAVNLLEVL